METQINLQTNQISQSEAMSMNRKDRRRLGKINGFKITGSNTDHIKKDDKPFALQTFLGYKK